MEFLVFQNKIVLFNFFIYLDNSFLSCSFGEDVKLGWNMRTSLLLLQVDVSEEKRKEGGKKKNKDGGGDGGRAEVKQATALEAWVSQASGNKELS